MSRLTIAFLSSAALLAAMGQLLFRIGARDRYTLLQFINAPIMLGLVLYGMGTAMWIYALSRELLVNVYAFTALTFVLVYLGGVFLLGEQINLVKMTGVALVLAGLYAITR